MPTTEKHMRSWVVDKRGVDVFKKKCSELGWRFHETSQEQTDLGKDGYLEFINKSSGMVVCCVGVQIKGERSLYTSGQYELKASKLQRDSWIISTVPIFGIVVEPDTQRLFWCDITKILCEQGHSVKIFSLKNNELNSSGGSSSFSEYAIARSISGPIALALASEDVDTQIAAAENIISFGKSDQRYFVLLRRTMFGLNDKALDHAIFVLGKLTLSPDVLVDKMYFGTDFCNNIRRHFKWSVSEVISLLSRIQNDGINRVTFGQNIYWLIVGDNKWGYISVVKEATILAASLGNEYAAGWGLYLCVFWARDEGESKLLELVESQPLLNYVWSCQLIRDQLNSYGQIVIEG